MTTIHKYKLRQAEGDFTIKIPRGWTFLSLQTQWRMNVLWAMVNPEAPLDEFTFTCIGTGQEVHNRERLTHLGTVQMKSLVWHYFWVR